ncbi:hypothetical protein PG984_006539 [Apiospora sp. TS-2023a]
MGLVKFWLELLFVVDLFYGTVLVQALVGSDLIQRHQERAQEEAAAAQARRGALDNAQAIAVRAFARQQGWAECGRCGRIIDRIEGIASRDATI